MYRLLVFTIFLFFCHSCKSQKNTVSKIENIASKETEINGKKMNILFIPVDDLNHWITYFGRNNQCKTPNLDRLSAMGVSFTNAHYKQYQQVINELKKYLPKNEKPAVGKDSGTNVKD